MAEGAPRRAGRGCMTSDQRRMNHFLLLSRDEQRAAVARLHLSGMSDTTIATASGLAVEQIRRILSEPTAICAQPLDELL